MGLEFKLIIKIFLSALYFFLSKKYFTSILKPFFLRLTARIGDQSIRWVLENEDLEPIGMHFYWKQPVLKPIFFIIFLGLPFVANSWFHLFSLWILFSKLLMISWIDAATGTIPNFLSYLFILSGIEMSFFFSTRSLPAILMCGFFNYFILWSISWMLRASSDKLHSGQGDFIFFAGIGTWLGFSNSFLALFFANILALVVCVCQKYSGCRYAPYLAYGSSFVFYLSHSALKTPALF